MASVNSTIPEPDVALGQLEDSFKWFLANMSFNSTPAQVREFFSVRSFLVIVVHVVDCVFLSHTSLTFSPHVVVWYSQFCQDCLRYKITSFQGIWLFVHDGCQG